MTKILIILILILIIIIINKKIIQIYINDIFFIIKMQYAHRIEYDNNLIISKEQSLIDIENIRILIISFDNRTNLKYLELHNNNIINYCKKWKNMYYEFINKCDHNVYWCKLYLILEKLNSNKYDYIMWMDTDSIIINNNLSLKEIVSSYSSDIFISHDNIPITINTLCSGVFIIKNSANGKNFIHDCINYYEKSNCKTSNNKLLGIWAQKCYEQGSMNYYIYEKYLDYTTILKSDIINNTNNCIKNSFILHKFGSSEEDIYKCFNNILRIK